MKKTALLAIVLLAIKTAAHAVPVEINYQGVLTDQAGNPINGVRAIQLKIYDAPTGGNITYTEDLGNVSVQDGICSFSFGANGTSNTLTAPVSGITDAIIGSNQAWVETSINGVSQTPRQKILTVPYALVAKKSEDAQLLDSSISTLQTQTSGLSSNMTAVQVQVNGVSSNVTALSSNLTTLQSQSTSLTTSYGTLNSTVSQLSQNNQALTNQIEDTQNQIQRINMQGIPLPMFISGNATSNLINVESNASYIQSENAWSSKFVNPSNGGGSASPPYSWIMTYEAKINCICTQISGYIEVNSVYNASNGRLDIVYADGSINTALTGVSSRDFTIYPSQNMPVKSLRFYGKSDNGYGISVYGKSIVITPKLNQTRYVDINLSSNNIQTASTRLITDALSFSNLKYTIFSGQVESPVYNLGVTNNMTSSLPITKIRIYLIPDNNSADLSGSSFKTFSLRY